MKWVEVLLVALSLPGDNEQQAEAAGSEKALQEEARAVKAEAVVVAAELSVLENEAKKKGGTKRLFCYAHAQHNNECIMLVAYLVGVTVVWRGSCLP